MKQASIFDRERGNPPAPPEDQIEGSDQNAPDSASEPDADIDLGESVESMISERMEEHNEKHGDDPAKKATEGQLKSVARRAMGAYSTSHREGVSRQAWASGRIDAYLHLLAEGEPESDDYVQDNDLLPPEHPKSTRENPEKNFHVAKVEGAQEDYEQYRRDDDTTFGRGVHALYGIREEEGPQGGKTELVSLHYPAEDRNPANAERHARDLEGTSIESFMQARENAAGRTGLSYAPRGGSARGAFYTPTGRVPREGDLQKISEQVKSVLGASTVPLGMEIKGKGILVGGEKKTEGGGTMHTHAALDVIEGAIHNVCDGGKKSTLMVAGDSAGYSLMAVFDVSGDLPEKSLNGIEALHGHVVQGTSVSVKQSGATVYVDPGAAHLSHAALDVAEILTRRMSDEAGLDVTGNRWGAVAPSEIGSAGSGRMSRAGAFGALGAAVLGTSLLDS